MKRNQLWINTRVELQWNPVTQQYEEVSVEGYWADVDSVAYAHASPSMDQDSYAWYNDGTESGSTIIGTANNSQSLDADTTYLVRFVIQEVNGASNNNVAMQLEYDVNNSGTWNNVTSTSTSVRAVASTNLTDSTDTTQRIGAGTFISPNGGVDSGDGATTAVSFSGSDEVEVLYSVQLRSADLTNGDTVQLRVAGMNTYTNTANATASVPNNVTVTPTGQNLTVAQGTLTVARNFKKAISPVTQNLPVTEGTLSITTTTVTDVTLTGQNLPVSAGTLTVARNFRKTVTLTGDSLAIGLGTLSIVAKQNVSVTLAGASLAVSAGTLTVQANVNTVVTPTGEAVPLSAGTLTVTQNKAVDITLTPQGIALAGGSVVVQANVDTDITLAGDVLAVTGGTLSISVSTGQNVTLSGQNLAITEGNVVVWYGATLDSIPPDSGRAYYCQGGAWHMIYPRDYRGTITDFTYVSSLADLPAPSAGVITLKANHTYYFIGDVDLQGNRMVGQFNTCILGSSSENAFITSTGLGVGVALFTTTWTTPIRHVTFKDVDTALDIDGLGNAPVALDWTGVNFTNIPNIGVIKDVGNFIFTKGAFLSSQGLSFDGTFGTISIADSLLQGTGAAGAIVTLPSTLTVTRRFRIIYSSIVAFGSTTGLDVSTTATIPVEGYILDTINFSGGSTYQAGVTFEDNKALFVRCRGITNSREVSQYYMNGNLTATAVASAGVAYKVAGTTTSNTRTSKFVNTDNRATYVGAFARNFHVVATMSMSSGTNQLVGSYIAKNGTVLTDSEIYLQTDNNGDIANVAIQALVDLSTNDYIEVFVENATAATDITVSDMNVTVQ